MNTAMQQAIAKILEAAVSGNVLLGARINRIETKSWGRMAVPDAACGYWRVVILLPRWHHDEGTDTLALDPVVDHIAREGDEGSILICTQGAISWATELAKDRLRTCQQDIDGRPYRIGLQMVDTYRAQVAALRAITSALIALEASHGG